MIKNNILEINKLTSKIDTIKKKLISKKKN